jgi:hypothetical protein
MPFHWDWMAVSMMAPLSIHPLLLVFRFAGKVRSECPADDVVI